MGRRGGEATQPHLCGGAETSIEIDGRPSAHARGRPCPCRPCCRLAALASSFALIVMQRSPNLLRPIVLGLCTDRSIALERDVAGTSARPVQA
jgi:hypothetical protein